MTQADLRRFARALCRLQADVSRLIRLTKRALNLKHVPSKKNPHAVALGKKGGEARKVALSPERRSEIARVAINTRWANLKAAKRKVGRGKAAA